MPLKLSKATNGRPAALVAWGLPRARFAPRRSAPRRFAPTLLALAAGTLAAASLAAVWRHAHAPRVWKPGEVPVAFWAWRSETPSQAEVERAARETGARVLFLRAGQMDLKAGRVVRVRAVSGRMPRGVELHLVYNATPRLLAEFGRLDEGALAAAFVETFRADAERAGRDGAAAAGLQLDVDVPTRLLARYGRVLSAARAGLRGGVRLSVTGLPTWMASGELQGALDAVDFWAPQFYGAEVPGTLERLPPIASPRMVAREVARARALGKPFYAGLAAYGHALLYDARGRLVELRGDLDPARVVSDRNLELVERRPFGAGVEGDGARAAAEPLAGEWRYVFRARADAVLDGLVVRAGEQLVLDVPGGESLRAGALAVRAGAGEGLLGICLFRLPTGGDAATLPLPEVAAALADREPEFSTSLSAETSHAEAVGAKDRGPKEPGARAASGSNLLLLTASNDGAGGALYGEGALSVTLRVPRGSVRGVTRLEGFDTFETLCESTPAWLEGSRVAGVSSGAVRVSSKSAGSGQGGTHGVGLRPCSAPRAGIVRLGARAWPVGGRARAGLSFEGGVPARIPAEVAVRREVGRAWELREDLSVR